MPTQFDEMLSTRWYMLIDLCGFLIYPRPSQRMRRFIATDDYTIDEALNRIGIGIGQAVFLWMIPPETFDELLRPLGVSVYVFCHCLSLY